MSNHEWTPEQQEMIRAVADDTSSLDVRAVAGSGKTTTMVAAAAAADASDSFRNAAAVAFNKEIATTLAGKMPYGVDCRTTHSIGLAALRKNVEGFSKVDMWKSANYLEHSIGKKLWQDKEFADGRREMRRLISWAKQNLLDPADPETTTLLLDCIYEKAMDLPFGMEEQLAIAATDALQRSNEDFNAIDFDDMLYLPLHHNMNFPSKFDLCFVDEAQDLAMIQHSLLRAICTNRVVAVGDPFQAIYGWRGAVTNSMDVLRRSWGSATNELTFSFRCGSKIVEEAQKLVPHIKSPPGQHSGAVCKTDELLPADFSGGEATVVVCRNNKPLIDVAFYLFKRNIPCYVVGSDIGGNLLGLANSLGCKGPKDIETRVTKWRETQVARLEARGSHMAAQAVRDRADTLIAIAGRLLAEQSSATFVDLKRFIGDIFKNSGPSNAVRLFTIHKAKGLEFENVIFYGTDLIPNHYANTKEELQQENNLAYVAITRAIKTLTMAPVSALLETTDD